MSNDGFNYVAGLETELMQEWRAKSRRELYRREPEAWLWDVLGYRWHAKQREIAADFIEFRRTATKSSNGAGKSRQVGELISWGVATHEPGELLVITSAPTLRQIEETTFAYLSANYGRAKARGFEFHGYLTDATHWNYRETSKSKSKTLVLGQRPSDRDIVGSFQGIRAISDKETSTWVFIDEGGAVHDDLFVAAEAVTTGAGNNRINVIGNPDRVGTYFQKIFEDPTIMVDWKQNTISAHDLPTFTGEVVYPDNPEMQHQMLNSGMIDRAWVEQKKRAWGEESARYRSKVLGLFPDSDDWSFFSMRAINAAEETTIEPNVHVEVVLGCDLADGGEDDSKIYTNQGGRIRHYQTWNEGSESPNRIHEAAIIHDADLVVMDRLGVGAGPFSVVTARADRMYTVIGAKASERSPDPSRWANSRAYWYDVFREAMLAGLIDLDYSAEGPNGEQIGKALRDQLMSITYDFNLKGAILLESKKDMRKRGVTSPDDLDAAIFSYAVKAREIMDDPLAGMEPGDIALYDPWDELESMRGMPV